MTNFHTFLIVVAFLLFIVFFVVYSQRYFIERGYPADMVEKFSIPKPSYFCIVFGGYADNWRVWLLLFFLIFLTACVPGVRPEPVASISFGNPVSYGSDFFVDYYVCILHPAWCGLPSVFSESGFDPVSYTFLPSCQELGVSLSDCPKVDFSN